MMKNVVFCEVCGVEKKDVNHWFVVLMFRVVDKQSAPNPVPVNAGIQFPKCPPSIPSLHLFQWDEKLAVLPGAKHFCGAAHAMKKVSEFLGAKR
jgi:hypothetical protein